MINKVINKKYPFYSFFFIMNFIALSIVFSASKSVSRYSSGIIINIYEDVNNYVGIDLIVFTKILCP